MEDIKTVLKRAANQDINIKINYQIDTSVDFLDVSIINEVDRLKTTLYHEPAAEPYISSYKSDHPRHSHRNIPYAALLRALRICSNLHDFNTELVRIDMSLLLNGFPPNFITKQFNRLFDSNHDMSLSKQIDQHTYHCMHHALLHQPTRREKQLHEMMQDPVESPSVLQPKVWNRKVMYPRYSFDSGKSATLRREFFKWWKEYYTYPESTVIDVKVRLVANTYRTLEHFFIHKKPLKELLTRMEP